MNTRTSLEMSTDFARYIYKLRYTYVHLVVNGAGWQVVAAILSKRSFLPQAQNEGLQYKQLAGRLQAGQH
jgi:hypothetical protein